MSSNSIKVIARFRPQNKAELDYGGQPIVRFDGDDTLTVDVRIMWDGHHEAGGEGPVAWGERELGDTAAACT